VTHGIKRGRLEIGPRTALYLSVLVVVLTLLAALYLMLVSRTAARGRHIEELRAEILWLQRENEQLEIQVAIESSIDRLWQRAKEFGFDLAEEVESLTGR
jgi:cell division protein FtsL